MSDLKPYKDKPQSKYMRDQGRLVDLSLANDFLVKMVEDLLCAFSLVPMQCAHKKEPLEICWVCKCRKVIKLSKKDLPRWKI